MPDLDFEAELASAQAAYLANLSYAREGDANKAHLFVEACLALKMIMPTVVRQAGRFELQFKPEQLDAAIARANKWLAGRGGDAVIGFSFENFR